MQPRPAADRQGAARRWRTLTFLAGLRRDAVTAPCVFDGPINGRNFLAYVEQILAPALKPGDIVVMDNLGSHKARRRSAPRSARPAPSSSSCRPIAPTSTRSSSSSPSSSTRRPKAPKRPSGPAGTPFWTSSTPKPTNATSISSMHEIKEIKVLPLFYLVCPMR